MIDNAFLSLLRKDGVFRSKSPGVFPLTGGVSSEIYRVDDDGRTFVVKRALKKLKVKADWYADVSRNRYEAAFLRYVGAFMPQSVPHLLGEGDGYFVMEFLNGFSDWKHLLLEKNFNPDHARHAGILLGQIHHHSFADPIAARQFDGTANFRELRISPYLDYTAERHPDVSDTILEEAERLTRCRECLIHGDFSPKNILIAPNRMVLVDSEVAYYGDPAFDIGFLLCHLLLKGLYHAPEKTGPMVLAETFWTGYQNQRTPNGFSYAGLAHRVSRLLPMLLLARVDGKSQVEYLDEERRAFVRTFALKHIKEKHDDLQSLIRLWFHQIDKLEYRENKIN